MNIEQPIMTQLTANQSKNTQSILDIRQATIDDLELLTQWTALLHRHEDDGVLKMHQHFLINLNKWLQAELNNSNNLFLIALSNGEPAGFIFSASVINDNGFLESTLKGIVHLLWVDESFRKLNIAATLLDEVEKCLASIGISYVECNYTANNQLAKSFWDKKHYKQSSITARKIL